MSRRASASITLWRSSSTLAAHRIGGGAATGEGVAAAPGGLIGVAFNAEHGWSVNTAPPLAPMQRWISDCACMGAPQASTTRPIKMRYGRASGRDMPPAYWQRGSGKLPQYRLGGTGPVECVEVQPRRAAIEQPPAQLRHHLGAERAHRVGIVAMRLHALGDPARDLCPAQVGEAVELAVVGDRHDARHDRHLHAQLAHILDEAEIGVGIEEILRS